MRAGSALVAWVLTALSGGRAAAADEPPTPTPAPDRTADIRGEIEAGRVGSAVVLCEDMEKRGPLEGELKPLCASALVQLGDRLALAGSPENARTRWLQAATLDPRLLDDAAFAKKLEGTATPAKPTPKPVPKPDPKRDPKLTPAPTPKPEPKPKPRRRVAAGPRWDRTLGLGLSVGFDGVVAMNVGWLVDEQWLVEVTMGIVYPTADARFRWLGMRSCLTPYIGAGILVPFGTTDRFDLDVPGFQALYELGEAVHVDLGLAWTPVHRLDLYVGVAFLTPFDQDHPDTVVFFPQLSGGISWYF